MHSCAAGRAPEKPGPAGGRMCATKKTYTEMIRIGPVGEKRPTVRPNKCQNLTKNHLRRARRYGRMNVRRARPGIKSERKQTTDMKERYIADLKKNEDVTTFLLVKDIAIKVGANKKAYLDLLLGDRTGEINGKKWDIAEDEVAGLQKIKKSSVIKIRALVTEWNGQKQLRVSRIRQTGPADNIDMMDYVKTAPESSQSMYDFIREKAEGFADGDLRCLCTRVLEERREPLMYYPAAQKNHHAELGGLLYHVKRMLMMAERVCEVYTNLDRELLMAGVILHDQYLIAQLVRHRAPPCRAV